MITSLKISRFRAINNCKIDGLARINIFLGRNNSGKSSILEALYLSSAAFNFSDPLDRGDSKLGYLLNRRCDRGLHGGGRMREILWYGYDSDHPIEVEIKAEGLKKLRIELLDWHPHPLVVVPKTRAIEQFYQEELRIKSHSQFPYACFVESKLVRRDGKALRDVSRDISSRLLGQQPRSEAMAQSMGKMMFVDTNLIHEMQRVERSLWSDLLKKRLDKLITEVLRRGYDVDVEDLTYMPYGDTYQLAVKLPKTTTRADDLGDGARYSMVLLMVAALAKSTVLLVEEPENHQHPGGLAKSIEMALDLIKRNDIQLFASTHSREFSILMEQIAKEQDLGLATFFIERDKKGNIESRRIDPRDADNLRKLGLDVRFLDVI